MEIDRILYPIESLGPGKRLVIWTVGCSKHCDHCANKELWNRDPKRDVPVKQLFSMIQKGIGNGHLDGVTFTGGDPMEQCEELTELMTLLKPYTDDILVYTGYTLEELQNVFSVEQREQYESLISVLIDGRYIDDLNDSCTPLRGSTNQRIVYWNTSVAERYQRYLDEGRKVQNVYSSGKVVSVGIHNKDL